MGSKRNDDWIRAGTIVHAADYEPATIVLATRATVMLVFFNPTMGYERIPRRTFRRLFRESGT